MIRINLLPVKELEAESVRRSELTIGGTVLGLAFCCLAEFTSFNGMNTPGWKTN